MCGDIVCKESVCIFYTCLQIRGVVISICCKNGPLNQGDLKATICLVCMC